MNSQLSISFNQPSGSTLRDEGILRAVTNAEKKSENWKDITWKLFKDFLKEQREPFMMESFREWLALNHEDYSFPPSLRAYGYIPLKAAREGLIIKDGYGKVSNSKAHDTPASIWRKVE